MSVIVLSLQGRFGNQAMQWLFARAYAERHGFELQTPEWDGERVFKIDGVRPHNYDRLPRYNEAQLMQSGPPDHSFVFRGYAQTQWCVSHYTKRQAQAWLTMRPEIETACARAVLADGGDTDRIVCHCRRGDYIGYGYVQVSTQSYKKACERFGLNWESPHLSILTEEDPTPHIGFLPDDLGFFADFYRMMVAPTLLRGNSSFSWLAALLGDGLVLAPLVEGLEGGKSQDCAFVAGNWPRFANLDFTENLYVSP